MGKRKSIVPLNEARDSFNETEGNLLRRKRRPVFANTSSASGSRGRDKVGLMVRYDWDKPGEVVGFECLDFSLLIPHLAEPGVVPELDLRFDVEGTTLVNVTLTEVLHWAYERYVLQRPTVAQPHPVPTIAVREKPKTEYKQE